MTPTQKLREAEKLATKGPWHLPLHHCPDGITVSAMTNVGISAFSTIVSVCPTEQSDGEGRTWDCGGSMEANRDLIALTRNTLPSLLDYVEALETEVAIRRSREKEGYHCEAETDLARRRFEDAPPHV